MPPARAPHAGLDRVRLGISACLLGEHVRYDGGHKRDGFLVDVLGSFVDWVPVCPEIEIGLGVPRDTMRLVGTPHEPRLVFERTGDDITSRMRRYAARRSRELQTLDLDGYVLKRGSPSCGLFQVPVHADPDAESPEEQASGRGRAASGARARAAPGARHGRGLFAAALTRRLPALPVEEEGRLRDPAIREHFIERVFAAARWRSFVRSRPRAADLVAFHAAHKLTLLAHHPRSYAELGRAVSRAGRRRFTALLHDYGKRFMHALATPATRARHVNALEHAAGFLKKQLSEGERAELTDAIEAYRRGLMPLIVPNTLLGDHVRRHGVSYLATQHYLDPYPKELAQRNRD